MGDERAILSATLDLLAEGGVGGATLAAIGRRSASGPSDLESRYGSAAALIVAAVESLDTGYRAASVGPYEELVAELLAFRRAMAHPGAQVAGYAALDEGTWAELARLYRERVIRPQRSRLRRILDHARRDGLLDADDAEVVTAVSCCIGSWYGLGVAGVRPARDWASTVARLTWRSLGGVPPA